MRTATGDVGDARQRSLLLALVVDSVGTGLYLPASLLFLPATTGLSLERVGLALSLAAGLALPCGPIIGTLVDRTGPRQVLVAANLLQATGIAAYLLVQEVVALTGAALCVALGAGAFWAAYPALIVQLSDPGERERWFGKVGALRNVGFAAGGMCYAGLAQVDSQAALPAAFAANAVSFLVAGLLLLRRPLTSGPTTSATEPTGQEAPMGAAAWRAVAADRPYLALTVVNVAFALNSFALTVALPVYVVGRLGLPAWLPGLAVALNCCLVALAQARVVAAMRGRRRVAALRLSSGMSGAFALAMLLAGGVPARLGVALVLAAVVLFTLGELIETPVLSALSAEAAPEDLRGRYLAVYQLSWNASRVLSPLMIGVLVGAGRWPVWIAFGALAAVAAAGITAVARRLPAATAAVGSSPERVALQEQ